MVKETETAITEQTVSSQLSPKKKSPWRWFKRLVYSLLVLLILIIGLISFIIFTEPGLRLVDYALKKSPVNEMVQIDNLSGTVWKGISFDRLHIVLGEKDYIDVLDTKLTWDLSKIYQKKVAIESLSVNRVGVILPTESESTPSDPDSPPFLPFSLDRGQLPVDIVIDSVNVDNVNVVLPNLSIYSDQIEVQAGVINQTTWAFGNVIYKGVLNIGEDMTLPLNATLSLAVDKVNDQVNIRLKNTTTQMRIGEDYFDHAMNIIVSGTLNDLVVQDAMTLNWPNKLAKPLVIEAKVGIQNQADLNWDLTLFNVSNQLASKGQWSMSHPTELTANLDLYLNELKDAYPELSGSLKGDLSFSGDFKKPLLSADIRGNSIAGFGAVLDDITLKADHNEVQTTELLLDLAELRYDEFAIKSGQVKLAAEKIESFDFSVIIKNITDKTKVLVDEVNLTSIGTMENHDIHLKVRSIFNTTDFAGVGHIDPAQDFKDWSLDINQLDVYSDIIGRYELSKPSKLTITPNNIDLSMLCLQELPTTMCMQVHKTEEQSFGSLAIRRLQPKRLNSLLPPEVQMDTMVDFVVSGQFTDAKNFNGIVDASLAAGQIRYQVQGYELNVPLKKTQVIVHAKPAEVTANINVDWGSYLQIHGGGNMTQPFGDQVVQASVHANAPTLNWLLPIIPALQKLEGKLTMDFETSGHLQKGLDIGLRVDLTNGEIYNAEYNTLLKNIGLSAVLTKGQPVLTVNGGLMAGKGKMNLSGKIDLKTLDATIQLKGDSLLLADSQNVKVLASPDVNVVLHKDSVDINGKLLIPELKFIYKSSDDPRGSVEKVSPDTVVISSTRAKEKQKSESKFWTNSTMNFDIILGNQVTVGAVGFVGKLMGNVDLRKNSGGPLTALGIVNMGSGVYNILGQELKLDKGKIQFTGLDIANPNLEFQASRSFENKRNGTKVSVGVRVTGTVENPKLSLFSQPAMPTNSIVSYLALGTDVDSLTAVEILQIAKMAQRIASGDIITSGEDGGFAKNLGLTDFGVMKDLSGNTSLGIGKYLTKNFYAGVGFSLFEEKNSAFGLLRYSFLKYFSFDTQVSDEYSTIDLRFSKEF